MFFVRVLSTDHLFAAVLQTFQDGSSQGVDSFFEAEVEYERHTEAEADILDISNSTTKKERKGD